MKKIKKTSYGDYVYTTVHDFKTHLSSYMKALESNTIRAVMVQRRDAESCVFYSVKAFEKKKDQT